MSVFDAEFSVVDYGVLVTVMLTSTAIGIFYRFTGGRQSTTKEYLLADRNQHILPVALSLVAAHITSISVLGLPAEVYFHGFIICLMNIAFLAVFPICIHWYTPVFFKVGNVSSYEYLERRFGHTTRTIAAVTYPVHTIVLIGLSLYVPSIALELITGLPRMWSIVCVGCICTFYSAVGGLKAIIMTETFQFILTNCAIISIILSAYSDKGSFSAIWQTAVEGGRVNLINYSLDPTERHTWWSLVVGGFFTYMATYSVQQTQVQRYLTLKDHSTCAKCLYLSMPITIMFNLLLSIVGLCIYSRYQNCDPYTLGKIKSLDQLLPFYLMDALGHLPGVPGLIVSGVFCSSLSSISANMNSMTTITLEDYIKPLYLRFKNSSFTDKESLILVKIFIFVYGGIAIATAFLAQYISGVLQISLTLVGVIGSPIVALFTLGMFCPSANEPGAITSIVVGIATGVYLGFGISKPTATNLPLSTSECFANATNLEMTSPATAEALRLTHSEGYFYLARISYLWTAVISTLTAIVAGYVVSWYARKYHNFRSPTDPDVFSPLVRYISRLSKEDVDEVVIFEKNRIRESIKEEDFDINHLS